MNATSSSRRGSRARLSVDVNRRSFGVLSFPIWGTAVLSAVFGAAAFASDVESDFAPDRAVVEVTSDWTRAEDAMKPAPLQTTTRSKNSVDAKSLKSNVGASKKIKSAVFYFSSIDDVRAFFNDLDSFDDSLISLISYDEVDSWRYSMPKVGRLVPPPKDSSNGPSFSFEGYGGIARAFRDGYFLVFSDAHLFHNLAADWKNDLIGIELFDGTLVKPERVAYDLGKDHLVMEFPLENVASKIRPLKFRNNDRVRLDETIRFVSPSEDDLLSGTVAKPDPNVKKYDSNRLFTLNAQIERGSSGSPVVDPENYVLGFIKSFYDSSSPEYRGKSFAIPSDDVLLFAAQKFAKERMR